MTQSSYTFRMPIVSCQICTDTFYVKPNRLIRGWGKFCSNECKHLGQKSGTLQPCHLCQKLTYRNRKEQTRSKSGKFFCSKSCQAKWRNKQVYFGSNHANWKGGESSYRQTLLRDSRRQICEKCNITDTRVLAVHHKDKNRQNNQVTNLIWLCHNCHYLIHHHKDEARGFIVMLVQ